MNNRTLEERLKELTLKLEKLSTQQDEIQERVTQIKEEVQSLREETKQSSAQDKDTNRTAAVHGSGYHIGDKVEIINPSRGQENQGVIIGVTKDNLLKIKPEVGKYIKRLPKNVRTI